MVTKTPMPTRMREFVKDAAMEGDDEQVVVTLEMRCPRCGCMKLILYMPYERVPVGADAGKITPGDPVWIACGRCRYHALLFDSASDGLNGYFDRGDVRIPRCKTLAWKEAREATYGVQVVVQYDIDPVQIDENGQIIPDAYDWITIVAKWSDGSMDDVIDFETA